MEVGAYQDGFCDPLMKDNVKARCDVGDRDRLTKSAHFLAVWMTFTLEEFFRLYIREIVWLHGVTVSIISERDLRFREHF